VSGIPDEADDEPLFVEVPTPSSRARARVCSTDAREDSRRVDARRALGASTSTVDRIVADALRVTLSHPASCACAGCRERARVEARERVQARPAAQPTAPAQGTLRERTR
jgi:hypothetical protein